MNKRLQETFTKGTVGWALGFLAQRGVELVTGLDILDGLLEGVGLAGGVIHANKDVLTDAITHVQEMTGKEKLDDVTADEWAAFKREHPNEFDLLEKALAI